MKNETLLNEATEKLEDPRNNLAIERTMLALERTQLAWIRTIIGLITAGAAIDRGFAALHEARLLSGEAWVKNGHLAGLVLTVSATLLILLTGIYYFRRMGELAHMMGTTRKLLDPGFILSVLITIVALLVVYFLFIA